MKPYKNHIPEIFNDRPSTYSELQSIYENQYFIDRSNVFYKKITITETIYQQIVFEGGNYQSLQNNGYFRNIEFLSPRWNLDICVWFSLEPNDTPMGRLKLGLIREKPIVIDIKYGKKIIDITSRHNLFKEVRHEKFSVEPGDYYLNVWYNGHNKGSYCTIDIIEKT